MQKVVIVNLNGIAYHLEESAFDALGAYLHRAEQQLRDNPDRSEIVADLEQAIADKCSRFLGPHKTVVTGADMTTILTEMGPVHVDGGSDATDGSDAATGASAPHDEGAATGRADHGTTAGEGARTTKRLYRMLDTAVIGGVCSGLAEYARDYGIDTTVVRIAVALLALFEMLFLHTPFIVLAYVIAMFVIPDAVTSEERAAARGIPFNAQQLIDEAKRNFARIGERDWTHTRRQWQQQRRWERKYQRQMRRSRSFGWTWPANPPVAPYGSQVSYGEQVAAGFVTPLLTIASVLAFWAMVYAVLSLASTGAVRGWRLPSDVPLWLGLLGLMFAYSALIWPLHAARRASYYRLGGQHYARHEGFDGVMSTIAGIAIVWAAYQYSPEVREWLRHLPDAWHNVVASFGSGSAV